MHHYIDITLLPHEEIGHYYLWSKLYQQMHLALVEFNCAQVGFSFPQYSHNQPRLGRKLRVFAVNDDALVQLNLPKFLSRLMDYCHVSSIRSVPEHSQYVVFSRKQCETNPDRLARRRAKRKDETLEQARKHFIGFEEGFTSLPYIDLESLSTQQQGQKNHRFKLFVERKLCHSSRQGEFNCYGLSKNATVPWF